MHKYSKLKPHFITCIQHLFKSHFLPDLLTNTKMNPFVFAFHLLRLCLLNDQSYVCGHIRSVSHLILSFFLSYSSLAEKILMLSFLSDFFVLNRLHVLEQFWVHSKNEQKVQRFPIYSWSPRMHGLPPLGWNVSYN